MTRLFPLPAATGGLTRRQEHALDLLTQHPEGLTALALGHQIHLLLGCKLNVYPCTHNAPCQYARHTGEELGKSLRKRDLVIKRGHTHWTLKHPPKQAFDEIPF